MPTSLSVIGAVLLKYEGLAFEPKPPVHFDQAPFRDASGFATTLPYVVVTDDGTTFEQTFGHRPVENTAFRFDIFAGSLTAADAVLHGIRFDTGAVDDDLGFDFAGDLPLNGLQILSMLPANVIRALDAARDGTARQVFRATLRYAVSCQRNA